MDKSSWVLIVLMILGIIYIMIGGGTSGLDAVAYLKALGMAIAVTVALVAVMSIPVLIVCYFMKQIPDIDYSIRASAIFLLISTLIGMFT